MWIAVDRGTEEKDDNQLEKREIEKKIIKRRKRSEKRSMKCETP